MNTRKKLFDPILLFTALSLVGIGLVMVTSSSLTVADNWHLPSHYFAVRQGIAFAIGLLAAMIFCYVPMNFWQKISLPLLFASLFLLILLLVPGVSRVVNGSVRWIFIGPMSFQISEYAKLAFIIYISSYLVRHEEEVPQSNFWLFETTGSFRLDKLITFDGTRFWRRSRYCVYCAGHVIFGRGSHYKIFSPIAARGRCPSSIVVQFSVSNGAFNSFFKSLGRSIQYRLSINPIPDCLWKRRMVGYWAWQQRAKIAVFARAAHGFFICSAGRGIRLDRCLTGINFIFHSCLSHIKHREKSAPRRESFLCLYCIWDSSVDWYANLYQYRR